MVTKMQESKNACASNQWVWMEFGILLRLVGQISLILFSDLMNIQGRESNLGDFVQETLASI